VRHLPRSSRAAWPLPLWLYPALQLDTAQNTDLEEEGDDLSAPPGEQQGGPKRATRVDDASRDGGLLVVRLENLFSWSEHVDLDRWSDDSQDPDAARVAEDLDQFGIDVGDIVLIVPVGFALVFIRYLEIFYRLFTHRQVGLGLADEAGEASKLAGGQ